MEGESENTVVTLVKLSHPLLQTPSQPPQYLYLAQECTKKGRERQIRPVGNHQLVLNFSTHVLRPTCEKGSRRRRRSRGLAFPAIDFQPQGRGKDGTLERNKDVDGWGKSVRQAKRGQSEEKQSSFMNKIGRGTVSIYQGQKEQEGLFSPFSG